MPGGRPNKKGIRFFWAEPTGFTLATLLVISTTLMIIGAAVLQGTLSVKNALNDQYYNELAREAAEAGIRYAQACVDQAASWTELRPNTNCSGGGNGTAPNYVVETDTYRTTFTVPTLDVRADTSTLATAKGVTELLRRESGTAYRTYTETLGRAVGASSMSVLPLALEVGGVALPDTMNYVLGYDGRVYGMGSNGNGRLGDGTTTMRIAPTLFNLPTGLTAKKISAAYHFVAVLASNGQVYTAGNNAAGQLGDGTTVSRSTPVRFQLPAGIFAVDILAMGGSAGCSCGYDTFVLASDGRIYAAGNNDYGQLTGATTPQLTPKQLPLPAGAARIKAMAATRTTNNNMSLVVLGTNGNVYGAGRNDYYQLGNSDGLNKTAFVQLAMPGAIKAADIKVGYSGTFVLGADSKMYGFGRGETGQLGNAGVAARYATAQTFILPAGLTVQKMFPGATSNVADTGSNDRSSTYVLASDHSIYGAGQNHVGQLGDATTTNRSTPVKFQLPAGLTAQDFSTLYFTSCALASDRQVYCAGSNQYGQLGIGSTTNQSTPQKFPLPSGVLAVSVTVSFGQVFVTGSDGEVYGAGRNISGELGINNTTNQNIPTKMKRPIVQIVRKPINASMSYTSSYVTASDGNVYGAGRNVAGELGAGITSNPQSTPLRFALPAGYATQVSGGFRAGYVLSSNGQLYGAGSNFSGTLGIGNTLNQSTPQKFRIDNVAAGLTVRNFAITTSSLYDTTIVHASDNQVYGSGNNGQGQEGNGVTTGSILPSTATKYNLPAGVTAMKMFYGDGGTNNTTFVLGSDEKLYAAGNNTVGQLGLGHTTTPVSTPQAGLWPAGCYVADVGVGTYTVFVLCKNGDVYGAGRNLEGALGDATTTNRSTPVKFQLPAGLSGVKIIVPRGSDDFFTYILASDGNVYASGVNSYGQLGDASTVNRSTPVKVQLPAGLTAVDMYPGNYAGYILASDGQIYVVGRNDNGQLGDGTTTNRNTAAQKFKLPAGVVAVQAMSQYALDSQAIYGTADYFAGVLGSDGKLYVAGNNASGQLGTGNTTQQLNPVEFLLPQPSVKPVIIF
jgi:alpha-tubulin suppressor-like RCC1 family protein/Tfp pilus assembly protein PilX